LPLLSLPYGRERRGFLPLAGSVSRVGEASKISNTLISKLVDKKSSLKKIIENYNFNLTSSFGAMEDKFSKLKTQIINNLDTNFLVNIIYGRILSIISNNQLLNNKTYQLDVTIDLGKEMVNKYILEYYKKVKDSNPSITYINWKQYNQELIQETD